MATNRLLTTPQKYFKPDFSVNEEHIVSFRELYRTLSGIERLDGHDINETALTNAAQQSGIQADSDAQRDVLRECVRYDDDEQTFNCVDVVIQGDLQPLYPSLPQTPTAPLTHSSPKLRSERVEETQVEQDLVSTELTDVECVFTIKRRRQIIQDFVNTFLLKNVKENNVQKPTPEYGKAFLLQPGTLLALLIEEVVRSLGAIRQEKSTRLRLVEPLSITDDFGPWTYDHLRDIFEIELRPYQKKFFPNCWTLAKNFQIHCQLVISGVRQPGQEATSEIPDRPRTGSLQQFVSDVCIKEGNRQSDSWFKALQSEDIFTFSHLSNLKQTEWDNIKKLSMNAKRILKAAVDRERESVADDRRRQFEESSPDQEPSKSTEKGHLESRSELLANLHLIKLFIYYTLRYEKALEKHGALPKLEATCIDTSFEEMRKEGFADDGLFSTMGEFFLPLTISEDELKKSRSCASNDTRRKRLKDLQEKIQDLEESCVMATELRWDYDEKITEVNKNMETTYVIYINDRLEVRKAGKAREHAERLKNLDQQWQKTKTQLEENQATYKKRLEQQVNKIADYEKQIDEHKVQIQNIETELSQPQRPVDKGLVKPARGFIMYGPPGTGKSEIMSKLSMKLGIAMVGPPLAAGELNRPLVGESERVIIALASRCHRVPYAMCCLSIDEIDSLAPKRDEDSSEGKVDKISVLLSLIDGIKDVPNMMIFCATNRLHMMDEAFLRRMSGKFFVGRPSSQARTKILAQIPEWALESDLIDRLTIATTNFSGAACKAFTRAITVRCMATQRTNPNFHINYLEALKIVDRTAQQYQIFLGSETLPRLLLRNVMTGTKIRVNHLLRHMYTGRIIVDIHGGTARVEIINAEGNPGIVEHKLHRNETSVQSLLERLTVYGKDRNVQLLQLIDLNLLASQGAYDEKKVFETLKERYDECVAYTRSMIIYDLDALVGVNKSESDSSMGRSTSSAVVNQSVYTYVRARYREAVVEQQQSNDGQQQTGEKWAVAVIREPFLLRQFSSDVQFAKTKHEEDEIELERRKAEELLKCVKCKDLYIENENKMGNCVHHDGFIYDNSAADLATYSYSTVLQELGKLESDAINQSDNHEQFERQKNKFKWICCDSTVVAGSGSGGCKKGKHNCGRTIKPGEKTDPSTLDQATIKRWEDECQRNKEYNAKWLLLLENRS